MSDYQSVQSGGPKTIFPLVQSERNVNGNSATTQKPFEMHLLRQIADLCLSRIACSNCIQDRGPQNAHTTHTREMLARARRENCAAADLPNVFRSLSSSSSLTAQLSRNSSSAFYIRIRYTSPFDSAPFSYVFLSPRDQHPTSQPRVRERERLERERRRTLHTRWESQQRLPDGCALYVYVYIKYI